VAVGEWFYTSGDDRVFPQGFPVGVIKAARPGTGFQEILVEPSGMQHGLLEDVLILIQGVHQEIPDAPQVNQPVYIAPPPPNASTPMTSAPTGATAATGTEVDKLRAVYKAVGEEQGHKYGEGEVGSRPPDFTKLPATQPAVRAPSGAGAARGPAAPTPGSAPSGAPAVAPPSARPPDVPPAKKPAPVTPPAAESPADASRRANQAAGAPTGAPKGPPH